MTSKGKITMIVGPMFAEKSGELITTCETLREYAHKKVMVYKPSTDNRWSDTEIVSRIGTRLKAETLPANITDDVIIKVLGDMISYDVVAFDEVHFYSEKITKLIYELSMAGKDIYIAGLNLDYAANTFGEVGNLMALSDEIKIKRAYCTVCGAEAKFTQRIINGKPAEFGTQVVVGDKENYEVRCKMHYVHPSKAKDYNTHLIDVVDEIFKKEKQNKEDEEKEV